MTFSFAETVGLSMIAQEQQILTALQELQQEAVITGTDFVAVLDLYTLDDLLFTLTKGECIDLTEYGSHQEAIAVLEGYIECTDNALLPQQSVRQEWLRVVIKDYALYIEKQKVEFQEKFGFKPQIFETRSKLAVGA
ncbi:MAG TPA: hypothetical protein VGE31_03455 [Candidatus Paceibacterota bacterium]